ncbi:MAG: anti-sigma factor family protein [Candidatus Sulfotelmatobacter sp.]
MKCDEIRDRMPDVAAGFSQPTADEDNHLATCGKCAEQLSAMRSTMALLDEWKAPEPSPYFDVRLQARLREEMARPQVSWMQWFRRPMMAAALTVLMGVGVGLFFVRGDHGKTGTEISSNYVNVERGTAVSDLQDMDQNHQLYSDYDVLDDLDVQPNVNP